VSAKPWAEPGLPTKERAARLEWQVQGLADGSVHYDPAAIREVLAEALRAAEADAYARGKADGADEAATAAVAVFHRLRADLDAGHRWMSQYFDGAPAVCAVCDVPWSPEQATKPCPRRLKSADAPTA
jgi:hypothetical protein